MKTLKLLIFSLCLVVAVSCNKKDDTPTSDDTPKQGEFEKNFGNTTSKDFLGTVLNVEKKPIADVQITIGSKTATTDKNGVFIIKNASVFERFAYVKAKKTGFLDASRAVVPTKGTNSISIMMLEKTIAGTVSSGKEGEVKTDNGASVKLDGNYVKPDGTAYTGDVNVVLHHLDPTDENMELQMPGMLYAANANGEERMLQTFGMLAVELQGNSGEILNLANGSKATITMPLDPSIKNPPSSIPLWYFNEDKGYWIEEGEATLQGSNYIGEVTHFSFWNCDIPAEAVTLCVTVNNNNTTPIANARVTITSATYGTRGGYTNANGEVCGLIPKGESLTLNVYNTECGNTPIHTATVGPYTTDSATTIAVNSNVIISETVTGTFVNCDNQPITDGYVVLNYGNQNFNATVSNGTFTVTMTRCANDNTFTLEGYDYNNLQSTGNINYTFTTPNTKIGELKSCNAVSEFIQYTLDGKKHIILDGIKANLTTNGIEGNSHSLSISANSNDLCYMYAYLNENSNPKYIGTYGTLCEGYNGFSFAECLSMDGCNSPNMTFNLTSIGGIDEYIDINFSGSYKDYQGQDHTISGVYHVLLDNISNINGPQ